MILRNCHLQKHVLYGSFFQLQAHLIWNFEKNMDMALKFEATGFYIM